MVDGVMLLVDAAEGPLPANTFRAVEGAGGQLTHLVINKIDRPDGDRKRC